MNKAQIDFMVEGAAKLLCEAKGIDQGQWRKFEDRLREYVENQYCTKQFVLNHQAERAKKVREARSAELKQQRVERMLTE